MECCGFAGGPADATVVYSVERRKVTKSALFQGPESVNRMVLWEGEFGHGIGVASLIPVFRGRNWDHERTAGS